MSRREVMLGSDALTPPSRFLWGHLLVRFHIFCHTKHAKKNTIYSVFIGITARVSCEQCSWKTVFVCHPDQNSGLWRMVGALLVICKSWIELNWTERPLISTFIAFSLCLLHISVSEKRCFRPTSSAVKQPTVHFHAHTYTYYRIVVKGGKPCNQCLHRMAAWVCAYVRTYMCVWGRERVCAQVYVPSRVCVNLRGSSFFRHSGVLPAARQRLHAEASWRGRAEASKPPESTTPTSTQAPPHHPTPAPVSPLKKRKLN